MYSKRQLYKPAPKQNVGQKKVKKLVQGTLDTVSISMNNIGIGNQDDGGDNRLPRQSSNTNNSRQASHNSILARSVLSSTVSSDVQDDPSMSPCRSVPALTEYASPRAEPPSRCLDLSDTELNLSAASSASTMKQQPVMVCDASHLGSSPDNTEVEVVVEYEDSPARVICHTPSRSEILRTSELSRSSPGTETDSAMRRGPISLKFDSPKTSSASPSSYSNNNSSRHNLIAVDDRNREEAVGRKAGRNLFISEHSRGIIKEILAEEIGSRDCSSLSIYSHESSPPSRGLPRSSSPVDMPEGYPSTASSSNQTQSRSEAHSSKTPTKSKQFPRPLVGNVNFESDSDSALHSSSENNALMKGRVDRTPKVEAAMKVELLKHQNDSDSETCSLYEYVPQNNNKNVLKEKSQSMDVKSNRSQDIVKRPRSAKKKPGRVVASRFMQNATSTSLKNNTSSLNSTKSSIGTTSQNNSNITKPKIMTARASSRPTARLNKLLDATKSTPSLTSLANISNCAKKKEKLTSTPTQDESCCLDEIDASSIHPSYTMVHHSDKAGASDSDNLLQRNAGIVQRSKAPVEKITSLQQDIQYARYLQASYLSAQMKQSFTEQERQAMEQLHGLWKLHEQKRLELCQSRMELQRLKTHLQIDTALDITQSQLNSLEEKLPQVGDYYSNLCSALNNTQHQIATKDIYIPNKTEEDREAYEDRLESTLRESENLLKEITSKTGHTFPSLQRYVASIEAINGNVEESGKELCQGYKDLDVAHGLCSQLSSRMIQML